MNPNMALGHAAHLIGVNFQDLLEVPEVPGGSILEDPLGSKKPTLDARDSGHFGMDMAPEESHCRWQTLVGSCPQRWWRIYGHLGSSGFCCMLLYQN